MYDIDTPPPPALEALDVHIADAPAEPAAAPLSAHRRRRLGVVLAVAAMLVGSFSWVALHDAEPESATVPGTAATAPAGVGGFAALFLSTYLTAAGPDRDAAIRWFDPSAPATRAPAATDRYVTRIVTLGVVDSGSRRWDVHLAAEVLTFDGEGYAPDGIHHYVVGVVSAGERLTATSLPARVAAPAPASVVPAVAAAEPLEDESLSRVVDGFLASMLTGEGDLRSYVAPGSGIETVDPPAFEAVAPATVTATAGPGGSLHLRVVAIATPAAGSPITIEYHLAVDDVDGTWAVTDLTAGPPSVAEGGSGS